MFRILLFFFFFKAVFTGLSEVLLFALSCSYLSSTANRRVASSTWSK